MGAELTRKYTLLTKLTLFIAGKGRTSNKAPDPVSALSLIIFYGQMMGLKRKILL